MINKTSPDFQQLPKISTSIPAEIISVPSHTLSALTHRKWSFAFIYSTEETTEEIIFHFFEYFITFKIFFELRKNDPHFT